MTDYSRSKSYSYSDDRMQVDIYRGPYGQGGRSSRPDDNKMQVESYTYGYGARSQQPNDYFRSYSVTQAGLAPPAPAPAAQWQLQKGKSTSGSGSFQGWSLNDPEFQRRKRVASYKVYSVEGKVKGGFRRSFRWIKNKYTQVVYGWW